MNKWKAQWRNKTISKNQTNPRVQEYIGWTEEPVENFVSRLDPVEERII